MHKLQVYNPVNFHKINPPYTQHLAAPNLLFPYLNNKYLLFAKKIFIRTSYTTEHKFRLCWNFI